MKRLMRWASRLYPKPWRERYGVEFAALLEDLKPDLGMSLNIVKEALVMQVTSWNLGRILAVCGMLGALVAFSISFAIPRRYVSQAVLRITPFQAASVPAAVVDREVSDRIDSISQVISTRAALATTINSFNLYKIERSRMPLEDVLDLMKNSIQIRPVATVFHHGPRVSAFVVQFAYEDRYTAQRVATELVSRFLIENVRQASASFPMRLDLLSGPPNLPVNPISPRPSLVTAIGLAIGLALGAVAAYIRHLSRPMLASSGILEKNPAGTPVFRGTGVPVHALVEYLESDKTLAQFLNDFPTVTREAAVSALQLAKSFLVR
jgi:uncharacterized protein (DUF433 family)/uncharacterized protein involved in exopolysaccharide biosynthesis